MKVGTHNGVFHADDVFAVATLRLLGSVEEVVRTRDPGVLASCDVVLDVGLVNDPERGCFDHHQRGGAGRRDNGVPYASFGLIWRKYGVQAAGSVGVAVRVDRELVQIIDGYDNGVDLFSAITPGVPVTTIDAAVSLMNPTWLEGKSEESTDAAFAEAVLMAETIIKRVVADALAHAKAADVVRKVVRNSPDPRIIVLEENVPWQETIVNEAPEAMLVVYPSFPVESNGWGVQAVPVALGEFQNRLQFPREWAGASAPRLRKLTGVDDIKFCHPARFFAVAATRDGAIAVAEKVLAAHKEGVQ